MTGSVPALSRHAVDRRGPARTDEAALDALWASDRARVFVLTEHGEVPLRFGTLAAGPPETASRPADAFYLGADRDAEWFAVPLGPGAAAPRGRLGDLRTVGADLDDRDAGLVTHAVALRNWHATHRCCPRCGAPTESRQGGHVRVCTRDGIEHFPRTDPAVIMLVTDPAGTRALLGRQPTWPAGRYSCLAGFVEPGESAEQAVVREVREETAVEVRDVRYVASQPWPFPASLMLGYRAVADPDAAVAVGNDELEDARWFGRAELRADPDSVLPPSVSIARLLFELWLAEG